MHRHIAADYSVDTLLPRQCSKISLIKSLLRKEKTLIQKYIYLLAFLFSYLINVTVNFEQRSYGIKNCVPYKLKSFTLFVVARLMFLQFFAH